MSHDTNVTARPRLNLGAPEQVDRILIAVSIALWLAALGASVAAIVALVGLSDGRAAGSSPGSDTPWLLYTVIGVSAAVIIGAIPLLVRARRVSTEPTLSTTSEARPAEGRAAGAVGTPTPRLEPFGAPVISRAPIPAAASRVGFPTAAVDQVWLRCPVIIAAAMGAAVTAIAVGTYLLASEHDTSAWVLFGLAAVVTVLTPVIPWFFIRQLRTVLDESRTVTA